MKQSSSFQKLFLTTFTILGWAAIVLQFYLLLKNRSLPVGATIVQFFSYFTILTNILVASYSTVLLIAPSSKRGLWFSKPSITTSLAVYIIIVGAVYNIILRFLWSPTGLQKLVDEALHSDAFSWLLYPIFYLAYILMRGSVTNLYPYPFLEINSIGSTRVVINILVLCAVFFGMSLLLVGTGKLITSKKTIRTSE